MTDPGLVEVTALHARAAEAVANATAEIERIQSTGRSLVSSKDSLAAAVTALEKSRTDQSAIVLQLAAAADALVALTREVTTRVRDDAAPLHTLAATSAAQADTTKAVASLDRRVRALDKTYQSNSRISHDQVEALDDVWRQWSEQILVAFQAQAAAAQESQGRLLAELQAQRQELAQLRQLLTPPAAPAAGDLLPDPGRKSRFKR